jgi:hypothetical protein
VSKTIVWVDGRPGAGAPYRLGQRLVPRVAAVHDADSFFGAVLEASQSGEEILVPGAVTAAAWRHFQANGWIRGTTHEKPGTPAGLEPIARRGYMVDFDPTSEMSNWARERGLDVYRNPAGAVGACIEEFFPDELRSAQCLWMLSSSAGLRGAHVVPGQSRRTPGSLIGRSNTIASFLTRHIVGE